MRQLLLKKPERRARFVRWLRAGVFFLIVAAIGCRKQVKEDDHRTPQEPFPKVNEQPLGPSAEVIAFQPKIFDKPSAESALIGWARRSRTLAITETTQSGPGCDRNFRQLATRGWMCGTDIRIQNPPQPVHTSTAKIEYYFVKDAITPEYHRIPTKKEHLLVLDIIDRFRKLRAQDPTLADRFARGDRESKLQKEPTPPPSMKRFIQRGFYIAGSEFVSGSGVESHRSFLHTLRGTYVWQEALEPRALPTFKGVELSEGSERKALPVAWVTRGVRPMNKIVRPDNTVKFKDLPEDQAIARYTIVPWIQREYYGTQWVHQLENGTYLHPWFLAVAEIIAPPKYLKKDEVWIHIDRSEQTLVVYRGQKPIYVTLVSTGLDGFETPLGEFNIRAKYLTDSMGDIGADSPDARYSIDDVPYAMYFKGSLALHGTFWHDRFGLRRSHGCVNIAPTDAAWIFEHTEPSLPEGWHGISARDVKMPSTRIVITD